MPCGPGLSSQPCAGSTWGVTRVKTVLWCLLWVRDPQPCPLCAFSGGSLSWRWELLQSVGKRHLPLLCWDHLGMDVTFCPPSILQLPLFALCDFAPLCPIPKMEVREWGCERWQALGSHSEQTPSMAKGWFARAELLKRCCWGTCKRPRRAGPSLVSHVGTGSLSRCSTKGSHAESHDPSSPCSSGQCAGMGHAVLVPGILTAPILLPPGWSWFSVPSAGCTIGGSAQGSSASCSSQIRSQCSQDGQEAPLPQTQALWGRWWGRNGPLGLLKVVVTHQHVLACLRLGSAGKERGQWDCWFPPSKSQSMSLTSGQREQCDCQPAGGWGCAAALGQAQRLKIRSQGRQVVSENGSILT